MEFKNGQILLKSDLTIRTIRDDGVDIDIIIPTEDRPINLFFHGCPEYFKSRMQFSMVKNIMFRFTTLENNNIVTVHLLRNIDLYSSIVNFEIDYEKHSFEIIDKIYYVKLYIKEKDFRKKRRK
ncbi:hypothetical protein [Sporosalibacterium faouarense]|uniref:hypothetical protein n=1 Tax=Sporosalibacterium faouarense TaxID=516123 RepID=UPI00141C47B5|nr:hypothetical protein [Sporosalibacterium faouarense]MTI48387.1 hypothetical protein [Bacillota bacterium]